MSEVIVFTSGKGGVGKSNLCLNTVLQLATEAKTRLSTDRSIFGLYMTWGIGANDVANVMGTSVGSGAITVKTAIIIAAIFEFGGAALAGGHVTKTIRKGIIDPSSITQNPEILLFGNPHRRLR